MEMLIHGSNEFLLEVLPKLINVDLTNIDLENLKDLRDYINCVMHLQMIIQNILTVKEF